MEEGALLLPSNEMRQCAAVRSDRDSGTSGCLMRLALEEIQPNSALVNEDFCTIYLG